MDESPELLKQDKQDKLPGEACGTTGTKNDRLSRLRRFFNRSLKGRYVAGTMALLFAAVMAGYYLDRTTIVKKVEVTGNHFISAKIVIKKAAVPLGMPPDSMPYMRILRNVESLPWVKTASIRVVPPDVLLIQVSERQPIGILADQAHKPYFDADGVVMSRLPGKAVNVPLVYGLPRTMPGDTLTGVAATQIPAFLEAAEDHGFTSLTISEVAYDPATGVIALSQDNGVKLLFGRGDFSRKLRNWAAFYRQVIPRKGMNKLASVDLRFKGQVITKDSPKYLR